MGKKKYDDFQEFNQPDQPLDPKTLDWVVSQLVGHPLFFKQYDQPWGKAFVRGLSRMAVSEIKGQGRSGNVDPAPAPTVGPSKGPEGGSGEARSFGGGSGGSGWAPMVFAVAGGGGAGSGRRGGAGAGPQLVTLDDNLLGRDVWVEYTDKPGVNARKVSFPSRVIAVRTETDSTRGVLVDPAPYGSTGWFWKRQITVQEDLERKSDG